MGEGSIDDLCFKTKISQEQIRKCLCSLKGQSRHTLSGSVPINAAVFPETALPNHRSLADISGLIWPVSSKWLVYKHLESIYHPHRDVRIPNSKQWSDIE